MEFRTFVLAGRVSAQEAILAVDAAKEQGFRVLSGAIDSLLQPEALVRVRAIEMEASLPPPTWDDRSLHTVPLPRALEYDLAYDRLKRLLARDKIQTAADLRRITFEGFIRPREGLTNDLLHRLLVVEFMVRHRIGFRDLNPAAAFPTQLDNVESLSRMRGILASAGIYRLELLVFFTEDELRVPDLGLGKRRLELIKEALREIGLGLRNG